MPDRIGVGVPVQRRAAVPPPHGVTDPKFKAFATKLVGNVRSAARHQPARAKVGQAHAAAKPPANDRASQAKAAQVDQMGAAKPGTFDKAAFIAAVHQAIDKAAPKNLDEADNFKGSGKAAEVKGAVSGEVSKGAGEASKDVDQATKAAPDPSKASTKPVAPMAAEEPGRPPADPGAADAMPDKKSPADTSLAAGPAKVNDQMAEADVTEDQLANSNEPSFAGALADKKEAEAHAASAPVAYRGEEATTLQEAKSGAARTAAQDLGAMHQTKVSVLGHLTGTKETAKSGDEAKRAKVAADVEKIYDATKTEVTRILDQLGKDVDKVFSDGEQQARTAFEDEVKARMDAYKDDRYSGWTGRLKWAKDKLFGMPDAVNVFYEQGKAKYLTRMDSVVVKVADVVGSGLTRAKARVLQGRGEIKDYVAKLPADLKAVGAEEEKKVSGQFDQLDSEVDAKQNQLVQSLADKYNAASQALDDRITKMKEENGGLVGKALGALLNVIATITGFKAILEGLLGRAADAVGAILKDPIGFIGKLIHAVGAGFKQFVGNIAGWLTKGLKTWLFGTLVKAGIDLPETWDLKGILQLIMGILGLTWANIRAQIVELVGEPVMKVLEGTFDLVKNLIVKGPVALVELIIDKVGDLFSTVVDAIKGFLTETIITKAIEWILGLLTPVGAFVKAVQAIIGVVKFFIEHASQIKELWESITDSILSIAKGGVGGVADLIENTLGKAVPVVIGFLAGLLGLGGIADKIKEILTKVQAPVNNAIKAVIGPIAAKGKALATRGKAYVKGKVDAGKAWVKGKVDAAKAKFAGAGGTPEDASRAASPPKAENTQTVTMQGESHTLHSVYLNGRLSVTLASETPRELLNSVDQEAKTHEDLVNQTTGEGQAYHQSVVAALRGFQAEYQNERLAIQSKPPAVIPQELEALNKSLAHRIMAIAVRFRLRSFAYHTFHVHDHLESIRIQVRDQLEKHFLEEHSVGDGHANSATAAELALGWVHQSDQRHIEKTSTALAVLQRDVLALDQVNDAGIDLSHEQMYVVGKRTVKDCEEALNSPKAYLQSKGMLHAFMEDIERQRRIPGREWVGRR